jgi:hypothetical protein
MQKRHTPRTIPHAPCETDSLFTINAVYKGADHTLHTNSDERCGQDHTCKAGSNCMHKLCQKLLQQELPSDCYIKDFNVLKRQKSPITFCKTLHDPAPPPSWSYAGSKICNHETPSATHHHTHLASLLGLCKHPVLSSLWLKALNFLPEKSQKRPSLHTKN